MAAMLHPPVYDVKLIHQAELVSMIVYEVKLVYCCELVSALVDDPELVLTLCALLCIVNFV